MNSASPIAASPSSPYGSSELGAQKLSLRERNAENNCSTPISVSLAQITTFGGERNAENNGPLLFLCLLRVARISVSQVKPKTEG